MNITTLILIGTPVLMLAWVNGANDVSKGVATLVGSGQCDTRAALRWGTIFTVLGGMASILWGSVLAANFSTGFLATEYVPDLAFIAGAVLGAFGWIAFATRFGLPVSTTHALLGGIVGATLISIGPEGLHVTAIANKAIAPLLLGPLIAILLCWALLQTSRWVIKRIPALRPGCCTEDEWRDDPFRSVETREPARPGQRHWLRTLHWLSAGATSFARGLNDVPKIAAFLILLMVGTGLASNHTWIVAITLTTLVMGIGSLWGGRRVARVLVHRVTRMNTVQGLTANIGTALLVLTASPLGLPVSTTHVSTGSLLGMRFAERSAPTQADALHAILMAWVVTLPAAGILSATASYLIQEYNF